MPYMNTMVGKTLLIAELFEEMDIDILDFQVTAHSVHISQIPSASSSTCGLLIHKCCS